MTPNLLLKKKIGKKIKGRKSNIQHQQRVFNQLMKFLKSNYSRSFLIFINTEQNINNWFLQDLKKKKWFRNINKIKWIPRKQFN